MISYNRQTFLRWLTIAGCALLVTIAAKTPLTILLLLIGQSVALPDSVLMALVIVIGGGLFAALIPWLQRQDHPRVMIEYASLTGAGLFMLSGLTVLGITVAELAADDGRADPGGEAAALFLAIIFGLFYLIPALLCLVLGLILRRQRLADRRTRQG